MSDSFGKRSRPPAFKTLLWAGFIAGSLDILAAIIVYVYVMNVTTSIHLLQGIANGVFGKSAFEGGISMALLGLAIHYTIAFSFTLFYFLIFPLIPFLNKRRMVSGLLYSIFVWCVMNIAVLPLLHIANISVKWKGILRGVLILMFCYGLPVSLVISRYHNYYRELRK